jgi:predicted transcriptional regulator
MPVGDPGLWAMIGMAAMMGGTMQAPLTGMVFVLELSHDLNALPALMVGSVAALGVTVLWLRRSILTEKLARRGQHIAREYSVDLLELTRVGDVMDKDLPIVHSEMSVTELSSRIADGDPEISRRQGTLILDKENKLAGIITRGDILRSMRQSAANNMTVLEAGQTNLIVAYEDESLHEAAARMLKHNIGRLPVVERWDSRQVIGYLGRACIMAAQARFYEEEEVRGRGLIIPSMKTLSAFRKR